MIANRISLRLLARAAAMLLLAGLLPRPLAAQTPTPEQSQQVKESRAILDAFESKRKAASPRKLHVVYFTPSDIAPAKDYPQRIQRVVELIRDFYNREMKFWGLGPRALRLDFAEDKLVIHLVQGSKRAAEYAGNGDRIREEVLPVLATKGIKGNETTMLLFSNLTTFKDGKYQLAAPFVGAGNARTGTGWVTDIPLLDTKNLPKKEPNVGINGWGDIVSLGRYNTIYIGGTTHELGHAFGLPHNSANAAENVRGTALMGFGNGTFGEELRGEGKGSFLSLCDALRLASHPIFSGTVKNLDTDVKASFNDLKVDGQDKAFVLSGVIDSSLPCYAVIAYLDPDGGGDYDSHTAIAIPNGERRFSIACRDLVAGKSAELRLFALFVNGGTDQIAIPYRVAPSGQPNLKLLDAELTHIRLRQTLQPAIAAWLARDRKKFDEARTQAIQGRDASDPVVAWANKIQMHFDEKLRPAPADVAPGIANVMLSDCVWAGANVGWLQTARNHQPDENYFLRIGNNVYEKGLYAHAPSKYVFNLGGKWQSLKGDAGLPISGGSVVFVIKGDQKELWRSPVLKETKPLPFEVSLRGVQQLELIVEDAGDGNSRDAGLWLTPKLQRGK